MSFHYMLFPNFLDKAVTLSYDDGVRHDIRLVKIMSNYGIKGTFNLCSGIVGNSNRVGYSELKSVYLDNGNEVAVHGQYHHSLASDTDSQIITEVMSDRQAFEKELGVIVNGMAYANGSYDERVIDILKKCGVIYSRTVKSTEKFDISENFLEFHPTCHHNNPKLFELVNAFLGAKPSPYFWANKPKLFYLWGHSYEFENDNNWGLIEDFCKKIGGKDDVWYATNGEIVSYVNAYKSLVYSADSAFVYNPSAIDVYIRRGANENYVIKSGATVCLK